MAEEQQGESYSILFTFNQKWFLKTAFKVPFFTC